TISATDMVHAFKVLLTLLTIGWLAPQTYGFSLLGPFTSWMDEEKSYFDNGAIGGPMNLGEEYRWNLPVITYGFDESFVNYFGTNGMNEVEKAIQILNQLPPVSELSLDDFPTRSSLANFQAAAENLLDLKSTTL